MPFISDTDRALAIALIEQEVEERWDYFRGIEDEDLTPEEAQEFDSILSMLTRLSPDEVPFAQHFRSCMTNNFPTFLTFCLA